MDKRNKFSLSDEEKIIDFVKNNEILYNVRHAKFRDSEAKNRLWFQLANEINSEVDAIKKKWTNMRDYFIRNQTRKSTGKPATTTKRDESMMFLLDTSILKRRTLTNLPSDETYDDSITQNVSDVHELESTFQLDENIREELVPTEYSDSRSSNMTTGTDGPRITDFETPQNIRNKRRAPSADPTELLYELLSTRKPNPVDFLPPKSTPKDHLDYFFESLACTMRTFPASSIAKLKLKISQLVGEEEVSLTQQPNEHFIQGDVTNLITESFQ